MIRFNNSKLSKNKKLLVFVSNTIRKVFGGDRLKRLSEIIISFSKQIHSTKKKKNNNSRFWLRFNGDIKKIRETTIC